MYFLCQLKKFNLPKTMMVHFYIAIVESILTTSITIRYAAATGKDKSRLQLSSRTAEKVIAANLPSLGHARREDPEASEEDCGRLLPPWTLPVSVTALWQKAKVHQDHWSVMVFLQ